MYMFGYCNSCIRQRSQSMVVFFDDHVGVSVPLPQVDQHVSVGIGVYVPVPARHLSAIPIKDLSAAVVAIGEPSGNVHADDVVILLGRVPLPVGTVCPHRAAVTENSHGSQAVYIQASASRRQASPQSSARK